MPPIETHKVAGICTRTPVVERKRGTCHTVIFLLIYNRFVALYRSTEYLFLCLSISALPFSSSFRFFFSFLLFLFPLPFSR